MFSAGEASLTKIQSSYDNRRLVFAGTFYDPCWSQVDFAELWLQASQNHLFCLLHIAVGSSQSHFAFVKPKNLKVNKMTVAIEIYL